MKAAAGDGHGPGQALKLWCAKTFVNGRALAARACKVRRPARLARLGAWVDSEFPRNFSCAQAYGVQYRARAVLQGKEGREGKEGHRQAAHPSSSRRPAGVDHVLQTPVV